MVSFDAQPRSARCSSFLSLEEHVFALNQVMSVSNQKVFKSGFFDRFQELRFSFLLLLTFPFHVRVAGAPRVLSLALHRALFEPLTCVLNHNDACKEDGPAGVLGIVDFFRSAFLSWVHALNARFCSLRKPFFSFFGTVPSVGGCMATEEVGVADGARHTSLQRPELYDVNGPFARDCHSQDVLFCNTCPEGPCSPEEIVLLKNMRLYFEEEAQLTAEEEKEAKSSLQKHKNAITSWQVLAKMARLRLQAEVRRALSNVLGLLITFPFLFPSSLAEAGGRSFQSTRA